MNDNIKRAPMKELSKSFKETESSSSHESDVEKMTPESPVRDAEDSKTDDGSNKKVKSTTTPKKILQEETRERKSGRTNKSVYVEDTKTDDNRSEKVKLTTTPKKILQEKTPERKSGRTNKSVYTRQTENVDESSGDKTKTKSKEGMSRKDTEKIDILVTEKIHAEYDGNEDREDGFDEKRTPDGRGRRKRKKQRRERHTGTSVDEDNQQDNVDDIIDEQTKDESEAEMPTESKRRKLSEKKSPIKVTKSSKTEKPCDLDSENISKESDVNVKQSKHRKKTKRKRERHSEIQISKDDDKKTVIVDTVEENIKSSDDNVESLQVTGIQSESKNDDEDIHEKGSEADIHEKCSEEDIHEKGSRKEMSSGSDNDALDNMIDLKVDDKEHEKVEKVTVKTEVDDVKKVNSQAVKEEIGPSFNNDVEQFIDIEKGQEVECSQWMMDWLLDADVTSPIPSIEDELGLPEDMALFGGMMEPEIISEVVSENPIEIEDEDVCHGGNEDVSAAAVDAGSTDDNIDSELSLQGTTSVKEYITEDIGIDVTEVVVDGKSGTVDDKSGKETSHDEKVDCDYSVGERIDYESRKDLDIVPLQTEGGVANGSCQTSSSMLNEHHGLVRIDEEQTEAVKIDRETTDTAMNDDVKTSHHGDRVSERELSSKKKRSRRRVSRSDIDSVQSKKDSANENLVDRVKATSVKVKGHQHDDLLTDKNQTGTDTGEDTIVDGKLSGSKKRQWRGSRTQKTDKDLQSIG
ncbi:enolase-phosphatase E1-like [Ptychodera flava]|uniref:enolase-phosphatase E1-like n=1 Tax=Ptychodera flava TaxID=63121 RepID=UPI003969BEBF